MSGHVLADAQAVSRAMSAVADDLLTFVADDLKSLRTHVQAQLLLSCSGAAFAANTGGNRARLDGFSPGTPALLFLAIHSWLCL